MFFIFHIYSDTIMRLTWPQVLRIKSNAKLESDVAWITYVNNSNLNLIQKSYMNEFKSLPITSTNSINQFLTLTQF